MDINLNRQFLSVFFKNFFNMYLNLTQNFCRKKKILKIFQLFLKIFSEKNSHFWAIFANTRQDASTF